MGIEREGTNEKRRWNGEKWYGTREDHFSGHGAFYFVKLVRFSFSTALSSIVSIAAPATTAPLGARLLNFFLPSVRIGDIFGEPLVFFGDGGTLVNSGIRGDEERGRGGTAGASCSLMLDLEAELARLWMLIFTPLVPVPVLLDETLRFSTEAMESEAEPFLEGVRRERVL